MSTKEAFIHFFGILNLINSLYVWGYLAFGPEGQPEPYVLVNLIFRFMIGIGFLLDVLVMVYIFCVIHKILDSRLDSKK